MNTVISSKDARDQFAEIINQVLYNGREFIINRFDKPVAKIVPIIDMDETQEKERMEKIVARIRQMRKKFKEIYGNTDLTEIIIRERDKEYKKWTK